jgi:hypothetical protein
MATLVDQVCRFIYPVYPPYLLNATSTIDQHVDTSLGPLPLPGGVPNYIQMAIPGKSLTK